MNNIFDSHCHYDDTAFDDDRIAVINRLFDTSVDLLMHAATDEKSCKYGIEMTNKYTNYYTSIGFHPECIENLPNNYITLLEDFYSQSDKIKAVGEIGLDYHYEGYDRDKQIEIFTKQVDFAINKGLPVIVHCRNAVEDTMNILRKKKPSGVMHCFSGSVETAMELVKMGMYIGFTGAVTFKNSKKARRVVEQTPIESILLETDCPYMAPEGFRGQRSDSSMIAKSAETIGEIKGLSAQEVIDITNSNARKMFHVEH